MDEPHYRTKMLDILSTRMLQGESKSILADKSQANQDFYMRYSGPEKDLLSTFYSLTLSSLQVPGNVIASGNRMGLLSVIRTNDPDRVADMDTVVNYMGNYVGANAGNSFSSALLSEYNRIEALKKLSQSVSSVYKFTEEDKTKILLSFNLKTAQEVQAMNGKDYFEYVKKSINEGFKKMSETSSELQAENVSYMLTSLIQKTVRTVNAESFKADAPVKGQIAEDSIFSSEKLYDLLGEYAKSAEKINDILTIYRENEDQFTSKQDMILKTFFN